MRDRLRAVLWPSIDEVRAERERRQVDSGAGWLGWVTDSELDRIAEDARARGATTSPIGSSPVIEALGHRAELRRGLGLEAEAEDAWRCVDRVPGCSCTEAAITKAEVDDMGISELVELARRFATRAHRAVARKSPAVSTRPPEVPLGGESLSLMWPREPGLMELPFVPEIEPDRPAASRTSLSPAHVRRVPSDEEVEALNARLGVWPTSRSYTRRGRIFWES